MFDFQAYQMVGVAPRLVNGAALCYDWGSIMSIILLGCFALLACPGAAPADEIELQSGAVIEGKVQDLGDSIKVIRSGSSIVYPKHMIKRITPKKTLEEVYEDKSKALKDGDVEGRLELARWCVQQKLQKEAVAEFKRVVAASPDHPEARKGAGYVRVNEQWLTEDQANEAKGLVRHKGRWMTPEERNLEVALEEQKDLDAAILREVQSCLERIRSTDEKKRQEATDRLSKIDDKQKVKPYLAGITSSNRATRKFAYEELGRMKEASAARPLCRRALWDEDEALRPIAAKSLVEINHPDTALFLAPFLGEESVSARIRCTELMATFKDLRAATILVEALSNCLARIKHQEEPSQIEETTTVVNRTVILADGSRMTVPKVVKLKPEIQNKELVSRLHTERLTLVSALRTTTGQDFGDDAAKWRAWLQKRNP